MRDPDVIPTDQELDQMTGAQLKAYENRLRRMADRQGLRLMKSRMRDRYAFGYGTYCLVNARTGELVFHGLPTGYGLNLGHIHRALTRERTT